MGVEAVPEVQVPPKHYTSRAFLLPAWQFAGSVLPSFLLLLGKRGVHGVWQRPGLALVLVLVLGDTFLVGHREIGIADQTP